MYIYYFDQNSSKQDTMTNDIYELNKFVLGAVEKYYLQKLNLDKFNLACYWVSNRLFEWFLIAFIEYQGWVGGS